MEIKRISDDVTVGVAPAYVALGKFAREHGLNVADYKTVLSANEQKEALRNDIFGDVADLASLVGTMADGVAIALHYLSVFTRALGTATTLDDLKSAVAPFATELTALADDVDAMTVEFPYQAKGDLTAAITEIKDRSNRVAGKFKP